MPRQLRGTLQDLHTTQLLHLINLAKKTGSLKLFEGVATGKDIIMGDGETKRPEVVPGAERARIVFREGKLVYAQLTERDNHLATILHKANKLNDQQYRVIRERAASATDKALALLLINANYVSQVDIMQSIQQHTLEIVYDLMTWTREPFIFEEGEMPPNGRITVPIELENVIIQGTLRMRELDQLAKELPNLDFALRFPEAPGEKLKKIQLGVEEWRVVSFINPKNSIRQIAKACNMTDMQIRKIVYGLLNAGLVELVKPQEAPSKSQIRRADSKPNITPPQRPVITKLIDRIKNL
ncbi:MAG: DUF4388 domain-containing protein [Anaerolinea sp.]|nr:DUF4388 domain-containing protein [Anaerolinea sp.]MCC6975727.1 DUF4388 domain-containing protein [Anaerolineae bacterium]CAG1011591.1 hypothetical protein ANRL4_04444 [Anaerolineae bacterium]